MEKELGLCVSVCICSHCKLAMQEEFVKTKGMKFIKNGKAFFLNGFNSYWLMYMSSDPSTRAKVSETFAKASKYGMNVARTWAFNDGGAKPLQTSPGSYNQNMFKVSLKTYIFVLIISEQTRVVVDLFVHIYL